MFIKLSQRLDFADTRAVALETPAGVARFARRDRSDASERFRDADAADRTLLGLVICAAAATIVLAVASSIGTF